MENKVMQTLPGPVTWDALKAELMKLPKEDIVAMVDLWVKTYWTLQNYWMICVERDFGFDNTVRLDGEIWQHLAAAQGHRLKKVLKLENDIQSLAALLKYCAGQWVNAGFKWEFLEISGNRLHMRVNQCPMGTYRKAQNLELIPCKLGASSLYLAFARVINDKFQVTCLHAHPDPPKENTMCEWEFILP